MKGGIRTALIMGGLLLSLLPVSAQSSYQMEISILQKTAAAFDRCAQLIESAASVEEMSSALATTADELRAVFPEMTSVSKSHPDWGTSPPAEVEPAMKLFDSAVDRLFAVALPKATGFVNEHPAAEALQKAFGRVNSILYSQ